MTVSLPSRGNLGWLGALLAGAMSAAAFGFAFAMADTLLVFLSYFSPVPVFAAGLGAGTIAGAIAALTGTLILLLKTSQPLAVSYLLSMGFPAVLFTYLALRRREGNDGKIYWYPEGYLLTAAVLYSCALFLAAVLLAMGREGGLLGITSQIFNQAMEPLAEKIEPEQTDSFKKMIEFLPRIFPAMMGIGWLVVMLFNALAAQSTLKQNKWNLRGAFSWRGIEPPAWIVIAVAATGITAAFAPDPFGYVGLNLCVMLCLPLFFTGIAITHAWTATLRGGAWLLACFYILLAVLPWIALLVTIVGALDQGFHFRQRIAFAQERPIKKGEEDD